MKNSELSPSQSEEPRSSKACVVGLTGGLASGKSTVAKILSQNGVPVLDADVVVHDLYKPGAEGAEAVARIFGSGVLDTAGGVNRKILGGRVLRDQELRLALEAAIHPLVRKAMARWIDDLGDVPTAVVEAALMVETGSYRAYDVLVVTYCSRDQQLERALARGVPEERALSILEAQLPLDEKRRVAQVVVDNTGDLEDLAKEVARAWVEVLRLCREKCIPSGTTSA